MSNFYQRYPEVTLSEKDKGKLEYSKKIFPLPAIFIVYQAVNSSIVFNILDYEIHLKYLVIAVFIVFMLYIHLSIYPKLSRELKNEAYLKKYGTRTTVKWRVRKKFGLFLGGKFTLNGEEVIWSSLSFYNKKLANNILTKADNDKLPIIYNPENPHDFIFNFDENV